MAARTGMAELIETLRGWTETTSSDYTLGTATYWSDNQLQDALDHHRADVYQRVMSAQAHADTDGDALYTDYYFPAGYWEGTAGGTAVWMVQDGTGAVVAATGYTANLLAGHLRTTANTQGSAYTLTGRQFDMRRAAAEVWRRKAAHVASRVDWQSDNHRFSASQEAKRYLEMADHYEWQAPARVVNVLREDAW